MRSQLQGDQRYHEAIGDQRRISHPHRRAQHPAANAFRNRERSHQPIDKEDPMTFNPDDPKWTAYILCELDASEQAAMASLVNSSDEAREYLEELRVAVGALQNEMTAELPQQMNAGVAAGLTEAQRAAVQTAAEMGPVSPVSNAANLRWFKQPLAHPAWVGGLAVAALILISVAVPSLWRSSGTNQAKESVRSANGANVKKNIPTSPAITSEANSAQDDSKETVSAKENNSSAASKIPSATSSQPQKQENTATAPTNPADVTSLPGTPVISLQDRTVPETQVGTSSVGIPPNPASNPPLVGNNIINDVF